MKPSAFIVMPFGVKRSEDIPPQFRNCDSKADGTSIDFDAVYKKLLEPALLRAGCQPFRADSETSAGDIRTDMFFELVTADLVVADISIANPNVFYELGVRHGVSPRGVLVVHNSFLSSRPFDVSVDRSFRYDGSLFVNADETDAGYKDKLRSEVDRLGTTFQRALAGEKETTGSPVYEHLPGLVPVDWENIQTSRANYFGALCDNWLNLVRLAQSEGYPGDIQTLADDAPTLAHRNKILYQAALALIDLCRYRAAEHALRRVIEYDKNHFDAQIQLGLVLAQQGETEQAQIHLLDILSRNEGEPQAGDLLGQVYRHLWHLSWRDEPPETRKLKAIANAGQANQAVRSFKQAQQLDPRAYFAGFNAIILIALLKDLFKSTKIKPPEAWKENTEEQLEELTTVVQYCAQNGREQALKKGDSVQQFWATTTLGGIALVRRNVKLAIQHITEACSIPGATFFQLHTFQERLLLLDGLDFHPEFVKPALEIVNQALSLKKAKCACTRVFLWAGYPLDDKPATTVRFPESSVESVKKQIEDSLDHWKLGAGDLAICEGIHEGDLLFAHACLERHARVRLMLLEPDQRDVAQPLWPFRSEKWENLFHEIRSAHGTEVWFHSKHLGAAVHDATVEGRQSLIRRHKNWLINTARMEAEPGADSFPPSGSAGATRLYGLFLWNGEGGGENPNDPSYFIRPVNEFGGYEGLVKTIRAIPEKSDSASTA